MSVKRPAPTAPGVTQIGGEASASDLVGAPPQTGEGTGVDPSLPLPAHKRPKTGDDAEIGGAGPDVTLPQSLTSPHAASAVAADQAAHQASEGLLAAPLLSPSSDIFPPQPPSSGLGLSPIPQGGPLIDASLGSMAADMRILTDGAPRMEILQAEYPITSDHSVPSSSAVEQGVAPSYILDPTLSQGQAQQLQGTLIGDADPQLFVGTGFLHQQLIGEEEPIFHQLS